MSVSPSGHLRVAVAQDTGIANHGIRSIERRSGGTAALHRRFGASGRGAKQKEHECGQELSAWSRRRGIEHTKRGRGLSKRAKRRQGKGNRTPDTGRDICHGHGHGHRLGGMGKDQT